MQLDERSLKRLDGVHADLVKIVKRAAELTDLPFVITEGLRTEARQRKLVAEGASKTLKSRHLTGHAVDVAPLVDGEIRWDWPLFDRLAPVFKKAASELNLPLEWGGDWRSFRDGPHFQLPKAQYPAS